MAGETKIEAVLFDLDGVLIESFDAWHSAFNDTLEKFKGDPLTEEEFRKRHWGPPLEANMKMLGLGKEGEEYCRNRYLDHMGEVELICGAKRILESMDNRVGLVTNTASKPATSALEYFGLEDYFNVIITADDVENLKPKPDPVLRACDILGVDPAKVVFVGDTEADVRAARGAGCRVIGVGVDGDFRINDLVELPELLSRLES